MTFTPQGGADTLGGADHATPLARVLSRVLPTIQARLLAMSVAVLVPLFAMAVAITLEDYNHRLARLRQELDFAAADSVSAFATALGDGERLLRAIAASPAIQDGTPATCDAALEQWLLTGRPRYDELVVVDRSGQARCRAGLGRDTAGQDRLADLLPLSASPGGGLVVGDPSGGPHPTLPSGLWFTGEHFSGAVLATLPLDRLTPPARTDRRASRQLTGLVDRQNRLVPLGPATPVSAELARLLQHPGSPALVAAQADDPPFQFRSIPLPNGLRLLVGLSTMPQRLQARQSLIQRLVALGSLLLAGLAAMMAGVSGVVAQPVQKLAAAVGRWRDGGRFEPGPTSGAPREIAALSQSFGRAVTALDEREVQLREASAQQELLMQEIHHRVKNNLQIVASLLNLQASRIKLPEARAEFQAARDRIRALATLHRHLYAYGELHTINMRGFLVELCGQLLQAMGETPTGGRIKLDIEAPELRISSDQAVPMALIVTEAVSNAAKYAFPGGRSGHIAVRLVVTDPGAPGAMLRLTIEDDGVGISSARAETASGVRDGIGTHLIRGFARQLQATMSLGHEGGTRYTLDIPLHRGRVEAAPEPVPES